MPLVHSLLGTAMLIGLWSISTAHAEPRVDIGLFSQRDTAGWEQRLFFGETKYKIGVEGGVPVLKADSSQSASAFYRTIEVDLEKTPILNWSWRKQKGINPGDESEKSGDDYVARVYVIKDGGLFLWNTLTINYVWSYQHAKGEVWDSPFAGRNTRLFSRRDAGDAEMRWFSERRNVADDFQALHGKKVRTIHAVAIMTDSDNSGLSASAMYGDIYFSAE